MNPPHDFPMRIPERYSIFESYADAVAYNRFLDIERMFTLNHVEYFCQFEVELKLWQNDENEASVACVSAMDAFDAGCHQMFDVATLKALNLMVTTWAEANVDDLADQVL